MAGLASKKLKGLRWNPVCSTGITGLHQTQCASQTSASQPDPLQLQKPQANVPARKKWHASNGVHAYQSSMRGTCVTPKECHTTTSLFLMLRSCMVTVGDTLAQAACTHQSANISRSTNPQLQARHKLCGKCMQEAGCNGELVDCASST